MATSAVDLAVTSLRVADLRSIGAVEDVILDGLDVLMNELPTTVLIVVTPGLFDLAGDHAS